MRAICMILITALLFSTQASGALSDGLVAEYRMDECYWLDHSVEKSVRDEINGLDGAVYNGAKTDSTAAVVGSSGFFDGSNDYVEIDNDSKLNMTAAMTVALWIYPTKYNSHAIYPFATKRNGWNKEGWMLRVDSRPNPDIIDFPVAIGGNWKIPDIPTPSNWKNHWHFIVGKYDGTSVSLRLMDSTNDVNASVAATGSMTTSTAPIRLAHKYYNDPDAKYFKGYFDEIKIWNRALSNTEIETIYNNEKSGKNYDGTVRVPVECNATVTANTWKLVGIPADFRNTNNPKTTVADIFGDDLGGTYGTDWRIYRRDYSTTDNNSSYTYLSNTDTLDFGRGYWLGSKLSGSWSENGAASVDYDYSGNGCPTNRCVEINLTSVTHNFPTDGDDGTGPYRYNMVGFIGKKPVDWADCRFIVDGTVYTPSQAESNGYAAKQIWLYNPGNGGANGNGYTTCDDTMTSCQLEPYRGFWVELHGSTKGKTVKLLIPKE